MAGGGLPHPLLIAEEGFRAVGLNVPGNVVEAWVVMTIMIVLGLLATRKLSMVPGGMQNFFEFLVGGLESFVVANIGEKGRKVFAFLCGLFVFILIGNLLGFVPGFDAPTANINTNAAMAITVFLFYNFWGLKLWGPGYIKHFLGPFWWLVPLMLPVELISHLARPLSLTLRLFGNVRGGEIILVLLFILAPVISTIPMFFMFILAKTIQAFVFFMLSMIYLKGSLEHAH
ncbi:F0F1 ATP synthase subunit A [Desulfolutivibrio sulfoxidireducens]|uniref:F0F1 ATP synthase subunit A n=1 Tax=Desulfolutivibrio sulfoxidireducens TaxID=2773299 RepID=UPI00159D0F47|nr:F0F1 ATP synthase subunit A [Desulfolutivibrio sulfoxidireducens]QLA14729.1 F0F1 ATP synthase subunit A [Desulfolutivibrio sulfoxidireducens]QLA18310.1 F0F1 ATP synthase subunit A [Desulfolutivibrio sulfoxidireducens]